MTRDGTQSAIVVTDILPRINSWSFCYAFCKIITLSN